MGARSCEMRRAPVRLRPYDAEPAWVLSQPGAQVRERRGAAAPRPLCPARAPLAGPCPTAEAGHHQVAADTERARARLASELVPTAKRDMR